MTEAVDPRLIIVSGPSGAGKTSVVSALVADARFERAVTATTRPPRNGEVDGTHYHFRMEEEFQAGIARGDYLEHAVVYGHLYGTPRSEPERVRAAGRHCVLVVDVQGARTLREMGVEAYYVFVQAPLAELRRRLEGRGQDDKETIEERLAEAELEMAESAHFDSVLVNEDVRETAREVAGGLGLTWLPEDAAPAGPERNED